MQDSSSKTRYSWQGDGTQLGMGMNYWNKNGRFQPGETIGYAFNGNSELYIYTCILKVRSYLQTGFYK